MEVSLSPLRGNNAALTFPHTGYFGVTPVKVAGHARLKAPCQEALVPIRSIEVALRCFEIREGGPLRSSMENTLWESRKMLWTPPQGETQVVMDDWSQYFEMEIPPHVANIATGIKQLREWRVRWRVEITAEHKPITAVGFRIRNTYNLSIHDHRVPLGLVSEPPIEMSLKSNFTNALVRVKAPHRGYGPEEEVQVMASITPEDPYATIRKVQLVLERRMELLDHKSAVAAVRDRDSQSPGPSTDKPSRMSSLFSRASSPRRGPLPPDTHNNHRVISTRILDAVCDVTEADADNTSWSKGTLKLPVRGCRWDMAHTERTPFVDISFTIRVKVTLKPGKGRGSTQVLESDPIPIIIVACSKSERRAAARALRESDPDSYAESRYEARYDGDVRQAKRRNLHSSGREKKKMDIAAITNDRNYEPPPRYERSSLRSATGHSGPSRQVMSPKQVSPKQVSPKQVSPKQVSPKQVSSPPLSPPPRYRMSPTPAPSLGSSAASSAVVSPNPMPVDGDYDELMRRGYGRRISTTASEDEDLQPLRTRQKLHPIPEPVKHLPEPVKHLPEPVKHLPEQVKHLPEPPAKPPRHPARQPLPSLDTLGFGLPEVHAVADRPRTAPTFGIRQTAPNPPGRPQSSSGTFAFTPFARRDT